jgi:hypothetical protein
MWRRVKRVTIENPNPYLRIVVKTKKLILYSMLGYLAIHSLSSILPSTPAITCQDTPPNKAALSIMSTLTKPYRASWFLQLSPLQVLYSRLY